MIPIQTSPNRGTGWHFVVVWGVVAAVAGLTCFYAPTYLLRRGNADPPYGHPLILWFAVAFADLRPVSTMCSLLVVGIGLGLALPRYWLLLGCMAVSLPPVLNAVNVIHDCILDPTSHNLWPFEFVALAFISLPALAGAFLGSWVRRRLGPRSAS